MNKEEKERKPYGGAHYPTAKFFLQSPMRDWIVKTNNNKYEDYPWEFQDAFDDILLEVADENDGDVWSMSVAEETLKRTIVAMNERNGSGSWHKYQIHKEYPMHGNYENDTIWHHCTEDKWKEYPLTTPNTPTMTIIIDGERHFTLSAAAPKMGYTLATLRSYVKLGTVPSKKIGGRRYVAESTIQQHLSGGTK